MFHGPNSAGISISCSS